MANQKLTHTIEWEQIDGNYRIIKLTGSKRQGQHKGKTFVLAKGGYVVNNIYLVFVSDCYDTKKAAQMVATKKTKQNKFDSAHCKYIEPCEYTVKEVEVGGAS